MLTNRKSCGNLNELSQRTAQRTLITKQCKTLKILKEFYFREGNEKKSIVYIGL